MSLRTLREAETEGGVFRRSSVRPLKVGAGSGGRIGDEAASSAVEVVEKAGDPGCSARGRSMLPGPSSAVAAGGGDECNEDVV